MRLYAYSLFNIDMRVWRDDRVQEWAGLWYEHRVLVAVDMQQLSIAHVRLGVLPHVIRAFVPALGAYSKCRPMDACRAPAWVVSGRESVRWAR